MVREGIESSLRQKWQRLREHIQRMEKEKLASQENKENSGDPNGTVILPGSDAPTIENMEDEISRLKDKVQVYHSIIEQQEQVLHVSLSYCYGSKGHILCNHHRVSFKAVVQSVLDWPVFSIWLSST